MKVIFLIIISCFLSFSSKKSNFQKEGDVKIIAKVEKIDSLRFSYVIHIKNNKGKGIFTVEKFCKNNKNYKIKLKENKSYLFKLKKRIYIAGNPPSEQLESEYEDGQLIWSNKMGSVFYEECLNMCGLNIDNEVKLKK
ncbi:hypothetical protein [Chryseobacterium sp. EO14]|uniref:hypothetical protein n=1 Tax=Chryseobacterium sp. EO14 TaxID=2950551 RepID=UPI00210E44ED|nr:hypothetical protein [Chryseobacterium sp. EO14]MCQ4142706.1 hypothetical protein [Chryseobacterium sp. EO14]